ncbi:MAG TPA: alpha-hydroxy acid oxidase [Actinocrinis sp.]|jgi:4-hydroxymandelate oxidase
MEALSVDDFEQPARAALRADVWDYIQGGSGAEQTMRANGAQFERYALRPRVLVDVSRCDTSTSLLGAALAAPIGIAPMAYHTLAHPDGEVATAHAAREAGALFVASFFAGRLLEDIAAAAAGSPLWLQLYWLRDRQVVADLADRAAALGFSALALTVDAPKVAQRLRDRRNSFDLPEGVRAVNLDPSVPAPGTFRRSHASALERHSTAVFDPSITWSDLAWLRGRCPLPLVLKGILTAEDARLAVEHGADAVVVSNHGGRQLDGAMPSLAALPEVVEAVNGAIPVLVDGGFRRGTDILKALALGAAAVLVGRPILWGLACTAREDSGKDAATVGPNGAYRVLQLLRQELEDAMALAGRPELKAIGPDAVALLL